MVAKMWHKAYLKITRNFFILLAVCFLMSLEAYAEEDTLCTDNIYTNGRYGYSFFRDGFFIDDSSETIKTRFYTDYTTVDIFYEDFTGLPLSTASYVYYSNKNFWNLKDTDYIDIETNMDLEYEGLKFRLIKWKRKKLRHLDKDFPYYMLIDIRKNGKEAYTIYVNSAAPLDYTYYLDKFSFVEKDPDASLNYKVINRKENDFWSDDTRAFYQDEFSAVDRTKFGIFEPSTWVELDTLNNIEEENNLKFPYILEYYSLSDYIDEKHIKDVYEEARVLELTYQTSYESKLMPEMVYEVLDGEYDDKIEQLAKVLAGAGGPIFFRLNNEMNGDWCSYNALHFQRDTSLYREMWKYFHKKIREAGGDNVIFVFNPNERSFPDFKWNHYMEYFPGEDYVDVIGVTGYNTGNYYRGEYWRDFASIYDGFMPEYKKRFKAYDFYITEFGSNIVGGDRNKWLEDMFAKINDYGFKLAIYWNGIDWDYSNVKSEDDKPVPSRVYRLSDDPDAMKMLREYINQEDADMEAESSNEEDS